VIGEIKGEKSFKLTYIDCTQAEKIPFEKYSGASSMANRACQKL